VIDGAIHAAPGHSEGQQTLMYQKQIVKGELKLDAFTSDGCRQVKVLLVHAYYFVSAKQKRNLTQI